MPLSVARRLGSLPVAVALLAVLLCSPEAQRPFRSARELVVLACVAVGVAPGSPVALPDSWGASRWRS